MIELRHGTVTLHQGSEQPCQAQIHLTEEHLTVEKEELVYTSTSKSLDPSLLSKKRVCTIVRETVGGLGLSVKGGAEHNLPVLISRIFKDQAADKTEQLFVGDSILKVNNINIENSRHDDAVNILKNAGEEVQLTVKYFRPASLFLSRYGRSQKDEENNSPELEEPQLERQWSHGASIHLFNAYVTRYVPGTDQLRSNAIEVFSMNGGTTGVLECEDAQTLQDWTQSINFNINILNNQSMVLTNKLLVPSQQKVLSCWVWERISSTRNWARWKPKFLSLKGSDIYLFEECPSTNTKDWTICKNVNKIFECMFRILKESEYEDNRKNCFLIQTGQGNTHYLCVETKEELNRVEKAWYRANYLAVKYIGCKTFGCSWRGQMCGLTLDLNSGFSLFGSESKSFMWSYRFSQLKSSSDDGISKLKLHFLDDSSKQIQTREIETTSLQSLLYSIHAFLSAKLASVDPSFLINL